MKTRIDRIIDGTRYRSTQRVALANVERHGQVTHCECGYAMGEPCSWEGPVSETVIVEWMPDHLRASHEAAGNSGIYPHNGAIRIRCERSCAERLAHVWVDGEMTAELDPWVEVRR